jgi:hypothetical protein
MVPKEHVIEFIISLLMLVSVGFQASGNASVSGCQEAVEAFLSLPAERTLAAVSAADHAACWSAIASSNAYLNQLNHWAEQGNRWAAQYLAEHLRQLDGGNLEDALIALGQFSDHNMERLLLFANRGLLSKHELADALTMLPLSLSDNPQAQLDLLKARRNKVMHVIRKNLLGQKAQAVSAIDNFSSEIRSKRLDSH